MLVADTAPYNPFIIPSAVHHTGIHQAHREARDEYYEGETDEYIKAFFFISVMVLRGSNPGPHES